MISARIVTATLAVSLALIASGCAKNEPASVASPTPPAAEKSAAPGAPAPARAPAQAPKAAAPGEPTEVVLWHAYRAKEKEALEGVVKAFNDDQSEVRIRIQAVPYDPFVDKITITIPRGQGPDLFIFAHNMIGAWVEDDLLEPLGQQIPPDVLQSFHPKSVKALVFRKNIYALPLAFKSLALFYNKALLAEAPETMEALIAAVKPLQNPEAGVHGFVYDAGKLYNHAAWMHAFGGAVFDDAGAPALDTPGQREALQFVRGLHAEHHILPKGMSDFMVTSLFNEGKAIAVLNGPWFRAEIAEGVDYGVRTIPTVAGKTPKPFLGIEAVYVSRKTEKKAAAITAALHLAGAASARARMSIGKQPVTHLSTLTAGAAADPTLDTFMRQAESAVIMPSVPEMQLVWSTADVAFNGVIFTGKSLDEALPKAQAKVTADIASRGK